ncbi:glycosyltransferase family 4 protein [Sulfurimonas sp. HSL1-6]|uniref:glycosyltransferase family 4 protein n=1 Tax=Thiomicrolovo immobilis TaxID=3131935 RepID=UPI0031F8E1CC
MTHPATGMLIAHANFAKGFRGGERQTQLLIETLSQRGYRQRLLVRKGSELGRRCRGIENLSVIEIGKPYALHLVHLKGTAVLHAHETKAAQFALFGKWLLSVPYIVTRRVDHAITNNAFNRAIYASAAQCVALSEAIKTEIRKIVPETDVAIIPSAWSRLETDEARIRQLNTRFEGKFIVGQIGALVDAHKGQAVLIEAARILEQSHPDIQIILLGGGSDEAVLKAAAADLGNITFEGFVNNVGDYLACFDLFAFPSRYEGLGSILFDAMQFDVPIVASNVGGIPDIVHHEDNGLLVPPGDARALAEAIKRLYGDAALRERLSARARDELDAYSPAAMTKKYERLYRR